MGKRKKEKKLPVLLLDDLPNLGQRGEVVLVKRGYFKYLISQRKATLATKEKLESELKPFVLEEKIRSREKEIEKIKEEIEKLVLEFKINKYTSITREKIIKALKEKGFEISRSQVELKEKIKSAGEYTIPLHLGFNIIANLKIKVSQ